MEDKDERREVREEEQPPARIEEPVDPIERVTQFYREIEGDSE